MMALARREEEACNATAARNDAHVQGSASHSKPSVLVPNHVMYGLLPGFVPLFEGVVAHPVHTSEVIDGVNAQGPPL